MSSTIDVRKICEFCGIEFIAHKTSTRYCSHRCANRHYKQRKREAKVKSNNIALERHIAEKPIERIKDKEFLSITEAASFLGVSRPTVYLYLRQGDLKAKRIGSKYLIRRISIEAYFEKPDKFEPIRTERQAITEFYTNKEILDKYGISNSGLYKIAQAQNFPKTIHHGKALWSKKHIDAYFRKKAPDDSISEWYTTPEIQEKFGMTLPAIYCFVSTENIPRKKEKNVSYYSKYHFDLAKGVTEPKELEFYTYAEAMSRYNLTRDQLYHYMKEFGIPRVKKGKFTYIAKKQLDDLLDDLLAPPSI